MIARVSIYSNRWTLSITRRYPNSLRARQESLTFSVKSSFCTDALDGDGAGGAGSNGNYVITVPFPSGWPLFRELGEDFFLAGISKEKAIQDLFFFNGIIVKSKLSRSLSNWRWVFFLIYCFTEG